MGISTLGAIGPVVLVVLVLSVAIAIIATGADGAAWVARAQGREMPAISGLFRGWPLVIWIASAALHPDFPVRIAAGVMVVEHAARLLFERRAGRVIAGG